LGFFSGGFFPGIFFATGDRSLVVRCALRVFRCFRVVFHWDLSLEFSAVRGCFAIQEPFVLVPRRLMPCLLPVRFALSSRLRVFGPKPRILPFRKRSKPFVRFSPTFRVSHPQVPQSSPVLVRPKPGYFAPRLSLRTLQHACEPGTLLLTLSGV
jgi:hypothetical protein